MLGASDKSRVSRRGFLHGRLPLRKRIVVGPVHGVRNYSLNYRNIILQEKGLVGISRVRGRL